MTKKIAILATDDFEDQELKFPYDRLRNAGYKVIIVGPVQDRVIKGKRGLEVTTDLSIEAIKADDFDLLIIPGGYSPDKLRINPAAVNLVKQFFQANKPVAAICHGPQLLISAEVVKDRKITSWASVAVDLKNAGAHFVDEPVVIDRNLITSRKPADLPQFVDAIIAILEEAEKEKQLTA